MNNISKRAFLVGMVTMALTSRSLAERELDNVDDESAPLIIREHIPGVDPRYAEYATHGPYVYVAAPTTVRGRGFDYMVFYPKNHPSPRLIVFSHGALAEPIAYRDLLWHWVSHGFVVVAPLHRDSIIQSGPSVRKQASDSVSDWAVPALLEDPVAWQERAGACVSVITDIALIESVIGQKVNLERPMVVGHGYGAYIAMMLLGATVTDSSGNRRTFADTRFFGGIMMSPQGPGVMGLDDDSWLGLEAPSLFVLAENEIDFTGQPYQEKAKSYLLSKPGYKHIGLLKKGTSNSFSGQAARSNEVEKSNFQVLKAITTAFLLSYSDYNQQAFQDLSTDFFERMSLGVLDEGRR